jgi:tRNA (Thr-GGU) A37 N-methylase
MKLRNEMKKIVYEPIGFIHSPFKDIKGMPIQPAGAKGIAGTIEIKQEYVDGLQDIEGFSKTL